MEKSIHEELKELVSIDTITAAVILDLTGVAIETYGVDKLDHTVLAKAIQGALSISHTLSEDLNMGKFGQYLLDYEFGKTMITSLENLLLVVFIDPNAAIGNIRYAVKKKADNLAKSIKKQIHNNLDKNDNE